MPYTFNVLSGRFDYSDVISTEQNGVADHAVVRFDGTSGKLIEQSTTFLSYDDGTISNPATVGETTTERFGLRALDAVTSGVSLAAFGTDALTANTSGRDNTAVGYAALSYNVIGSDLSAFGSGALLVNTASGNSAFGSGASNQNTTGTRNSSFGAGALLANQDKDDNAAFGYNAGTYIEGNRNTSIGSLAGSANNIQLNDEATALGYKALYVNTGAKNTGAGSFSLSSLGSGAENSALGRNSGKNVSTASYGLFLGAETGLVSAGRQHDYASAIGAYATVDEAHAMVLGDYTDTAFHVLIGAEKFPSNVQQSTLYVKAHGSLKAAAFEGAISLFDGSTYSTIFQLGTQSADLTYTLPTAYPASDGYALVATTAGVMSWAAVADMNTSVYDPATIAEQLVGLTATQTLSNKSGNISMWTNDVPYAAQSYVTIANAESNSGITPVADGTYTVGAALTGGGTVGTITTVNGIITAVQQAT